MARDARSLARHGPNGLTGLSLRGTVRTEWVTGRWKVAGEPTWSVGYLTGREVTRL